MSLKVGRYLRLGVNIDHVATIRNARGISHPDPVRAAIMAEKAGADGITAHLREDRRHITDKDVEILSSAIALPLNLELAATEEMLDIALRYKPRAVCIVPEKREELTTEGGLDVVRGQNHLAKFVSQLNSSGIRVSLFIDPEKEQLDAAKALDVGVVELHTGKYCNLNPSDKLNSELTRIKKAAKYTAALGLECHAGHGLSFDSVSPIAAIPNVVELNIGHFLIGEAIFGGLYSAIKRMRTLMDNVRANLPEDK